MSRNPPFPLTFGLRTVQFLAYNFSVIFPYPKRISLVRTGTGKALGNSVRRYGTEYGLLPIQITASLLQAGLDSLGVLRND